MIYLKSFDLLSDETEYQIICAKRNIHETLYPLKIFPDKALEHLTFEPVTMLYGGNGSGKTTVLQIIASKLQASKRSSVVFGDLFDQYVSCCRYQMAYQKPEAVKLILSDDVFDYLLDVRAINSGVHRRKEQLSEEYRSYKNTPASRYTTLGQYEALKNKVDANRLTESKYIRSRMGNNTLTQASNGESALNFWVTEIEENSLYLIDEPENSLSAQNQIKLKQFIEDSARFFNCQFIIATHSPFLLSISDAKIYDLDETPVLPKRWTELKNVRLYYDFFMEKREEFEKEA